MLLHELEHICGGALITANAVGDASFHVQVPRASSLSIWDASECCQDCSLSPSSSDNSEDTVNAGLTFFEDGLQQVQVETAHAVTGSVDFQNLNSIRRAWHRRGRCSPRLQASVEELLLQLREHDVAICKPLVENGLSAVREQCSVAEPAGKTSAHEKRPSTKSGSDDLCAARIQLDARCISLHTLNPKQTARIMLRAAQVHKTDFRRQERMLHRPRMESRRIQALGRERGGGGRFARKDIDNIGM